MSIKEAEKDFMVARGIVREARDSLEAQQLKLKEVRDRLDRVSREDVQYLELATMEHKLLQEEKRLRASYVFSEESEREKFSLFSASVRESHEKERTRAERTKNWSVIGSVLGAVIGVMGSTYINRVRLQELKSLLLEAQKGPISLQAAIHEHASVHQSQQKDLRDLIAAFTNMLPSSSDQDTEKGFVALPVNTRPAEGVDPVLVAVKENLAQTKKTEKFLESLEKQYGNLDKTVCKIATDVQNVKARVFPQLSERTINSFTQVEEGHTGQLQSVVQELTEVEQRLGIHINRNSIYSTALTCTVFAVTLPILYILLKGN
ncbi:mitochondrial potassium channel isoform X2 [Bombina bombina]|uniref:mitochondrial potassium channel isoform X2 n=1 Tax=Bombina bombina TaxID=8345 RepID=UPI00235A5CAC|nr:mitochondrial potassium channel isoform X2 [Bombina bombina]